jgi:hypothetical protein
MKQTDEQAAKRCHAFILQNEAASMPQISSYNVVNINIQKHNNSSLFSLEPCTHNDTSIFLVFFVAKLKN